jgi:hypothetical protein
VSCALDMNQLHEPIPDCIGCRFPKEGERHERYPYETADRAGFTIGWLLGRILFIVLFPVVWPIAAAARFNQKLAKLLLSVLAIAVTYTFLDAMDSFLLGPLEHYVLKLPRGWLALTFLGLLAGTAFAFVIESIPATIDLYRRLKQFFLYDPRSKPPKSVAYHLRHGLIIAAAASVTLFVFTFCRVHLLVNFALNVGAALSALVAAAFWFISAAGKVPTADKTYRGFLNTPDEIISALKYSAKWNRLAALFAGVSALFVAAVSLHKG